ncbi:MAG TPA: hypothetical protein VMS56_03730 [Thermoanaerobaculia bacterium]|nr:hypothetical protein [Thermoanaerobaculia bacterium]
MTDARPSAVPVVLHYLGGRTEHVWAPPQIDPDRQTVAVTNQDGTPREVSFTELKAVFFLHDSEVADPGETPPGSTLAVEFADGELIRGITNQYNPSAGGFWLYPHDRSKNDRVFVVNSAVVSIDVEKL